MHISLVLAAATLLFVAAPAMAAERSNRSRTTPAPSIFIPAPVAPGYTSTFSHNSGSIESNSSVSTNSGGNQGGTVITGDQSATITVVNIGPASQHTQVVVSSSPQPAPEPACTGRSCPRTR